MWCAPQRNAGCSRDLTGPRPLRPISGRPCHCSHFVLLAIGCSQLGSPGLLRTNARRKMNLEESRHSFLPCGLPCTLCDHRGLNFLTRARPSPINPFPHQVSRAPHAASRRRPRDQSGLDEAGSPENVPRRPLEDALRALRSQRPWMWGGSLHESTFYCSGP